MERSFFTPAARAQLLARRLGVLAVCLGGLVASAAVRSDRLGLLFRCKLRTTRFYLRTLLTGNADLN